MAPGWLTIGYDLFHRRSRDVRQPFRRLLLALEPPRGQRIGRVSLARQWSSQWSPTPPALVE